MESEAKTQPKNETYEEIQEWDDATLNLRTKILRGIYAYGFEKPSPIQQQAILPIINKHDLIAQAQSGTGKTGCFTIGTLEIINEEDNNIQAIILSPTRELAVQIKSVIDKIGIYIKNLKKLAIIMALYWNSHFF